MDLGNFGDQPKLAYESARFLIGRNSLELVPIDRIAIRDRPEQLVEVVGLS